MLGLGCYLYAKPQNYLLQEVQSPAVYQSIVEAVAAGKNRPAEMADTTGIHSSNVSEYLSRLVERSVVSRETPVGIANKKQVLYRVSDNLFRFWQTFVPRYAGAIESGQAAAVAARIAERDFPTYMGHAFEDICRQWVVRNALDRFGVLLGRVGFWWGTDPSTRTQTEVDISAKGADGELIVGECTWQERPVGADVVKTLEHRATLVEPEVKSVQLVVFSKSGFAESAKREAARMGNVTLLGLQDIVGQ